MRIAILFIAALLAGCNSSDDDSALQQQISAVPNEATAIQALRAEVSDMQASIKKLQLIGDAHGVPSAERVLAIGSNAFTEAVSFGPCTDMGVLVGFVGSSTNILADPLNAHYQAFKQCTGYFYETDVSTGNLAPASRLYWDGPNCSGNMWEWDASGGSFNEQTLNNGVVFLNPSDNVTQLMVIANQTPQTIQAQSVYIVQNGDCEPDGDKQLMWSVTSNNISITGVPGSVGHYQMSSP